MVFRDFKLSASNPPCKDCQDRKLGCHSICERYIAYRAKRLECYAFKMARMDVHNYKYAKIIKAASRRKNHHTLAHCKKGH